MNRILASLLALASTFSCLQLSARTLSAAEALEAAFTAPTDIKLSSSPRHLVLADRMYDEASGETTLYVFRPESDSGFIILSANDLTPELILGYSTLTTYDPDKLPPALEQWLQACSYAIANNPQQGLLKNPAKANKQAIQPIVKTKWNQDWPYNNLCPLMEDQRAVTGCVATAIAQVMKVHQWPVQGQGSNSYTCSYNGIDYTISADFSQYTFDWDNMLNTYSSNASQTKQTAVAELMYCCGVASDMQYSPESSGTNSMAAATALLNNFDYDKGLKLLYRKWFNAEEWDDIIYDQLAQGKPLYYSGVDNNNGGHAFVCDGYSEGYYHINWGWGGYCDGYFLLSLLNPADQGIGGGTGDSGFCYYQDAIIDIQRPKENSEYAKIMACESEFSLNSSEYDKAYDAFIQTSTTFYSFSLAPISVTPGFHLVAPGGTEFFYPSKDIHGNDIVRDLDPLYGFSNFGIDGNQIPIGNFDIYPAFQSDGVVYDMYCDKTLNPKPLHLVVTEDKITVENLSIKGEVSASLVSVSSSEGDDDTFYPGHSYTAEYQISSTGSWDGKLVTVVVDPTISSIYALSNVLPTTFDEASEINQKFDFQLPSSCPSGDALMVLCYEDPAGYYFISDLTEINIENKSYQGSCKIQSVEFVGSNANASQSDPAILHGEEPQINVTVKCTAAPCEDEIYLVFADPYSLQIFAQTSPQLVSIENKNGTETLEFVGPWNGIEENELYAMAIFGVNQGQLSGVYYFKYSSQGEASVTSIEFAESTYPGIYSNKAAEMYDDNVTISVTMKCTKLPWSENIALALADSEGAIIEFSALKPVNFSTEDEEQVIEFTDPWTEIELNTLYLMAVFGEESGQLSNAYYFKVIERDAIVPVQYVGISPDLLTLYVGESAQLSAIVVPADASDQNVVWTSNNESIASVSTSGKVEAIAAGSTMIFATSYAAVDGTAVGFCDVTVVKYPQEIEWNQDFGEFYEGSNIELDAFASSGLPISYAITEGADIASINGSTLSANGVGTVSITASQEGNYQYLAAESVTRSINVLAGLLDASTAVRLAVEGNILYVSGLKTGDVITIITPDGKMVYQGLDRRITLMSNSLYIVRTPQSQHKITTR